MKSAWLTLSVMAAVTTLAAPAVAAEWTPQSTIEPTPATMQAVSKFVGTHTKGLTLYPTGNGDEVFVTYHTTGELQRRDHIGLIEAHGGQVTRFTDFSGPQPTHRNLKATDKTVDAQAQALALLVGTTSPVAPTASAPIVASTGSQTSAQSQAADLLRSTPPAAQQGERRRRVARGTVAVRGDSQAMARALLTATMGE